MTVKMICVSVPVTYNLVLSIMTDALSTVLLEGRYNWPKQAQAAEWTDMEQGMWILWS